MDDRRILTRTQARKLLEEATRQNMPRVEEGLTLADLETAATEVGIDSAELRQAATRMEQRHGLKLGLLFIAIASAAITAALLILPGHITRGWRAGSLHVHNEQRHEGATLEILAPRGDDQDSSRCEKPPGERLAASRYCLAQRIHLEPRQRARLEIPRHPTACPQIWVRLRTRGNIEREALFTLPAAVEIDRHGRLDQKGMGHPHMHPPPDGTPSLSPCAAKMKLGGKV